LALLADHVRLQPMSICRLARLALVGLICLAARASSAEVASQTDILPDLVKSLLPAVVNISVLEHADGSGKDGKKSGQVFGSGFIIDPAGYIVTNRHVVTNAAVVNVVMADETTYRATVLSTNARPDLALLKIDAGRPLPIVKFGNSDTLRIGETVIAIGNPLGLSSSVSAGVVSALNRNLDTTMIDDFIQTDAAINHGNSGGPLFNLKGEVVGINWALLATGAENSGSAGLGLAIPANDAAFVIGQMRRYGRLRAGFFGMRLQQLTPDMAAALGIEGRPPAIVTATFPKSPADKAGIQEGDIILDVDGRKPQDVRALLRDFSASLPGTQVTLNVWRDGSARKIEVAVESWPQNEFDPAGPPVVPAGDLRPHEARLGLRLAAVTASPEKPKEASSPRRGVKIVDVVADSEAAMAGLAIGDIILRVRNHEVAAPDDVAKSLAAARNDGLKSVLLLVQSGDRPHWVLVSLGGA